MNGWQGAGRSRGDSDDAVPAFRVHGRGCAGADGGGDAEAYKDVDALNAEFQAEGRWVFAGGLHPADTATVVRAGADGDVITTDGPFAETKEQLGGFWVLTAKDLDEALALAARATVACQAPVEVRPFQDEPEA